MNEAEKIWVLHVWLVTNCPLNNKANLRESVEKVVVGRLADLVTSIKSH